MLVAVLAILSLSVAIQAGPRSAETVKSGSFIGVVMQALDKDIIKGLDLNTKYGVLITEVVDDSPAEEAGIEDGDVIIEFNGMKVKNPDALRKMVLKSRVGEKVKVKLIRDDDTKVIAVVVGERPEETAYAFEVPEQGKYKEYVLKMPGDLKDIQKKVMYHFDPSRKLGVRVHDLSGDLGSYFDAEEGEGVLVLGIEDGSVAEEAGIKAGDVILSIAGDKIDSIDELKSEVKEIDADEDFDIVVLRHGKKVTLTAAFDEDAEVHSFRWNAKEMSGELPKKYDIQSFKLDKGEMEQLRQEMKQLQIELQKMKKQLKKELKDLDED